MEVPAGQDGIQQLLQAETEAQAIVSKARHGMLYLCFDVCLIGCVMGVYGSYMCREAGETQTGQGGGST